jgi:FkbM family methyltransferase
MPGVSYPNPDFNPQVHEERVRRWQASDSDERFRTNYSCLSPSSVILDLGGFNGDFSFRMNAQYGSTCHVFEVHPGWCERIKADARCNEKIIVHPFGLAGSTRQEKLFIVGEGSSTLCDRAGKSDVIDAKLIRALDWFDAELKDLAVDLAKINIEGGEYELLDHMLDAGLTRRLRNIQIQFHEDVIPDASARMSAIHDRLAVTHRLTFQEKFVWENWELR